MCAYARARARMCVVLTQMFGAGACLRQPTATAQLFCEYIIKRDRASIDTNRKERIAKLDRKNVAAVVCVYRSHLDASLRYYAGSSFDRRIIDANRCGGR